MLLDLFQHLGILNQFPSGHISDDLASQVVLRRTQPTAGNDNVRPLQRARDDFLHPIRVVANHGLEIEIHAQRRKALGHPRGIGVDDLTQKQFRSDRHDFCVCHRKLLLDSMEIYILAELPETRRMFYPMSRPLFAFGFFAKIRR